MVLPRAFSPGKRVARHGLVDQDHGIGLEPVARIQIAAATQGNAHGGEVPVADHAHERIRKMPLGVDLALGGRTQLRLRPRGERIGQSGGGDTMNGAGAAQRVVEIGDDLGAGGVVYGGVHADGGGAFGAAG